MLGRLGQQQVDLVTYFLLVSGDETGFGLLGRYEPRPTYFTYQLYKRFGDEVLAAASGVEM